MATKIKASNLHTDVKTMMQTMVDENAVDSADVSSIVNANIASKSTSDISEGTNLYFTNARADARAQLKVDAIVGSAPGTLDTLQELGDALGDDPNFATTVTNSIATKLPLAGGTLTGNVNFGDNDKAIFGAGSDLQIYHDGSSRIANTTGNLIISDTDGDIYIQAKAGENSIKANNDGSVQLYFDNALKFNTSSTGVDVTGTVTSDGLRVDGALGDILLNLVSDTAVLRIQETNANEMEILTPAGSDNLALRANSGGSIILRTNGQNERMRIDSSGRIGIGTATFTGANSYMDDLVVYNATSGSGAGLSIIANATNGYSNIAFGDTADWDTGRIQYNHTDNSMGFHANSAERMRIDSSGNVGIGTASPDAKLQLYDGALHLEQTDGSDTWFSYGTNNDNYITTGTSGITVFRSVGTERMRIDASGNVGIGTSSPFFTNATRKTLSINGTGSSNLSFGANGTAYGNIFVASNEMNIGTQTSANPLKFMIGGYEKARIDSSGNLLVGKTGINFNTDGTEIKAGGELYVTQTNAHPLQLNRLSSDGDIAKFYRDGTTVGSIGSLNSSEDFYINSTDDLALQAGGNNALAIFQNGGSLQNITAYTHLLPSGTNDVGASGAQWRNLHLSGNVNVGGTVDGRDVATDGTKLDGIATGATNYGNTDVQTYISGSRSYGNITTTGYLRGPSTFTIDPAAHGDNTGTLVIAGNLQVDGTTTTINSTTLTVDDKNITLASGAANAAAANGAGITVDGASATITYDATDDEWDFNKDINVSSRVLVGEVKASANQTFTHGTGNTVNFRNSSAVSRLFIKGDGNVGIGTDAPTHKLHVNGTVKVTGTQTFDVTSGGGTYISINHSGNESWTWEAQSGSGSDDYLDVGISGGTRAMSWHEDGKVGIGTSSPSAKLDVNGEVFVSPNTEGKNTFQLTTNASNDARLKMLSDTTTKVDIQANGASYFNGGNVGIGTDNPGARLHAYTTGYPVAKFERYGSSAATRGSTQLGHSSLGYSGGTGADTYIVAEHGFGVAVNAGTHALVITDGGNVGIGTSNPQRKLHIVNNATQLRINRTDGGDDTWEFYSWNDGLNIYPVDGASTVWFGRDGQNTDVSLYNGRLAVNHTGAPPSAYAIYANGSIWAKAGAGDSGGLRLHTNSGINVSGNAMSFHTGQTNGFSFNGNSDGADNNNQLVVIKADGNVGIGTVSPSEELEVAGTTKAEQYLLDAIAKDISDTAVDVFIYDTRKDSDGGAWRKRTQNTSWYNETLNTATRGARKEFPAVAVIVAESSQVTIYDGDDPDLPMWMVFNQGTQYQIYTNNNSLSSIQMLNGKLCWAGFRVGRIDFIKDASDALELTYYVKFTNPISGRNTANYSYETSAFSIINNTTNDVAMTVLPNAPIDSATGLPVPTIAVATNGGVSVIKDNGTVVDIVSDTIQHEMPREVKFVDDKVFWVAGNNYDNAWSSVNSTKIPTSDITTPYYSVTTANALVSKYTPKEWNVTNHVGDLLIPINMQSPRTDALIAVAKDNELIIGGKGSDDHGTVVKVVENLSDPESGMIAQIATDFATGYQVGDIKLTTLSDTDDTNVSDINLNPYTPAIGNLGSITLNTKKTYKVTITGYGDIDGLWPGFGSSTDGVYVYTGSTTAPGVAQATLNIQDGGTSGSPVSTTVYITNFPSWSFSTWGPGTMTGYSVQECDYNRTYWYHPVEVVGTMTKSAVATGADLVAYGGFSPSNYLFQPYNSQLNFGTGDFSFSMWCYPTAASGTTNRYVFDFSTSGGGDRLYLQIDSAGGIKSSINSTASGVVADNVWSCVTVCRRSGIGYTYINGMNIHTTAFTENFSATTRNLYIGVRYNQSSTQWLGKMALFRVSATAPSDEQIKKIYEDEKFLFQENAKATLYGSSDAVTALAYDDDTELLHTGTSAGRSVFQGLRRIDNTTDAVGAAISASNGMVAED